MSATRGRLAEPTPADVIEVAAELFDVTPAQLVSHSMKRPITDYRMAAMAACRLVTSYSHPDIATAFGRQGHDSSTRAADQLVSRELVRKRAEAIAAEVLAKRTLSLEIPQETPLAAHRSRGGLLEA